jgi:hypothetical protein
LVPQPITVGPVVKSISVFEIRVAVRSLSCVAELAAPPPPPLPDELNVQSVRFRPELSEHEIVTLVPDTKFKAGRVTKLELFAYMVW